VWLLKLENKSCFEYSIEASEFQLADVCIIKPGTVMRQKTLVLNMFCEYLARRIRI